MLRIFACMLGMRNISSRNRKERHGKCEWVCAEMCVFLSLHEREIGERKHKMYIFKKFFKFVIANGEGKKWWNVGKCDEKEKEELFNDSHENDVKKTLGKTNTHLNELLKRTHFKTIPTDITNRLRDTKNHLQGCIHKYHTHRQIKRNYNKKVSCVCILLRKWLYI